MPKIKENTIDKGPVPGSVAESGGNKKKPTQAFYVACKGSEKWLNKKKKKLCLVPGSVAESVGNKKKPSQASYIACKGSNKKLKYKKKKVHLAPSKMDESDCDDLTPTEATPAACRNSQKKINVERRKLRKKYGPYVDVERGPFMNTRSYICTLCVISATSALNLGQHIAGQAHQRKLQSDTVLQKKLVYMKEYEDDNSVGNQRPKKKGMSSNTPHSSKEHRSSKYQGYDPYGSRYSEEGPSSAGPPRDWSYHSPPQNNRRSESPPMPPIIGPYVGKEYKERSVERPGPYPQKRVAERPPPKQNWESDFRQPELRASSIQGITVDTEELMKMIENARPKCPTPPSAPSPEPEAPHGVMGTLFSTLENYDVNDKSSAQEALNIIHMFLEPIRDYYNKMRDFKAVALASVAEINAQSLKELDIFR